LLLAEIQLQRLGFSFKHLI